MSLLLSILLLGFVTVLAIVASASIGQMIGDRLTEARRVSAYIARTKRNN
jgi:hypothetical protein